jgi:hypothetical protein
VRRARRGGKCFEIELPLGISEEHDRFGFDAPTPATRRRFPAAGTTQRMDGERVSVGTRTRVGVASRVVPGPVGAVALTLAGWNGRPRTKILVCGRSCSMQRPPMTRVSHPGSIQVVNTTNALPDHVTDETFDPLSTEKEHNAGG